MGMNYKTKKESGDKKYIILHSDSLEELEAQVNDYLDSGWKCQGGVNVLFRECGVDAGYKYHQAMILKTIFT